MKEIEEYKRTITSLEGSSHEIHELTDRINFMQTVNLPFKYIKEIEKHKKNYNLKLKECEEMRTKLI